MPTPIYVRAFHEAGHAIVAHELGLRIEFVIIDSNNSFLRTVVPCVELKPNEWHAYMEKECICLGGGYAADQIQSESIKDSMEFDKATMEGMFTDKVGVEEHWPHEYEKQLQHFEEKNSLIDIRPELHQVNINWDGAVKCARDILEPRQEQLRDLAFKFYLSKGKISGQQIDDWLK